MDTIFIFRIVNAIFYSILLFQFGFLDYYIHKFLDCFISTASKPAGALTALTTITSKFINNSDLNVTIEWLDLN